MFHFFVKLHLEINEGIYSTFISLPVAKWEIYWRSFKILRIFPTWVRKQTISLIFLGSVSHYTLGNHMLLLVTHDWRMKLVLSSAVLRTQSGIYWKWLLVTADLFLYEHSIAFVVQGIHILKIVNSRFFILKSVCKILSEWIHDCDDSFVSVYLIFVRTKL